MVGTDDDIKEDTYKNINIQLGLPNLLQIEYKLIVLIFIWR